MHKRRARLLTAAAEFTSLEKRTTRFETSKGGQAIYCVVKCMPLLLKSQPQHKGWQPCGERLSSHKFGNSSKRQRRARTDARGRCHTRAQALRNLKGQAAAMRQSVNPNPTHVFTGAQRRLSANHRRTLSTPGERVAHQ